MNNEKGITLIELLVTIVIIGIIIVPLLTLFTGTFSRTIVQGKESQINSSTNKNCDRYFRFLN
jgi:prepilin-type N-terminal cleavage/methylation domain-containing protein